MLLRDTYLSSRCPNLHLNVFSKDNIQFLSYKIKNFDDSQLKNLKEIINNCIISFNLKLQSISGRLTKEDKSHCFEVIDFVFSLCQKSLMSIAKITSSHDFGTDDEMLILDYIITNSDMTLIQARHLRITAYLASCDDGENTFYIDKSSIENILLNDENANKISCGQYNKLTTEKDKNALKYSLTKKVFIQHCCTFTVYFLANSKINKRGTMILQNEIQQCFSSMRQNGERQSINNRLALAITQKQENVDNKLLLYTMKTLDLFMQAIQKLMILKDILTNHSTITTPLFACTYVYETFIESISEFSDSAASNPAHVFREAYTKALVIVDFLADYTKTMEDKRQLQSILEIKKCIMPINSSNTCSEFTGILRLRIKKSFNTYYKSAFELKYTIDALNCKFTSLLKSSTVLTGEQKERLDGFKIYIDTILKFRLGTMKINECSKQLAKLSMSTVEYFNEKIISPFLDDNKANSQYKTFIKLLRPIIKELKSYSLTIDPDAQESIKKLPRII